jgi:hypothetical protein
LGHVAVNITLVALSVIALQSCGGAHADATSPAPSESAPSPSGRPIQSSSESLPSPISCETWVVNTTTKTQLNQQMPDDVIKRIAEGQGLPAKFYTSGKVPPNFCRPVSGVWTFPDSQQHFYNADDDALSRQKVASGDRAVILKIVSRIAVADRFYVKWMYSRDGLIVFSMKPANTGIWVAGGSPYVVLNKDEIVTPDGGEVWPPPPGISLH